MADKPYDAVHFKMVNGDVCVKTVAPGQGPAVLVGGGEWIATDDATHVRADNIVSARIIENAHEALGLLLG